MNLTWLIYWVNVLDNVQGMLIGLMIISLLAAAVTFLVMSLCIDDAWRENRPPLRARRNKLTRRWGIVAAICAVVLVFLPGKSTVTLMLASEIGQKVVASQQAKDIIDPSIDYLKLWIKKQTNEFQKELGDKK